MHQKIVLLGESFITVLALESFDVGVSLQVLLEITLLRKGSFTSFNCASEWSLIGVAPQMIKEFVQTWENLATIIIEVTFKKTVLFFVFLTLFEVVELEVLAIWDVALEAKVLLNINILALGNVDSVLRLNLMILHELLTQYLRAGLIFKFASKITKLFLSTFELPLLVLNILVVGQVAQVVVVSTS